MDPIASVWTHLAKMCLVPGEPPGFELPAPIVPSGSSGSCLCAASVKVYRWSQDFARARSHLGASRSGLIELGKFATCYVRHVLKDLRFSAPLGLRQADVA
jgi:hypothetical protein